LFGGPRYGGIDLPELYTDQGFGQLKFFDGHLKLRDVGHLELRDEVGQQILCFLSELQLFIGVFPPILTIPYSIYGQWVGEYWVVSLWKQLAQIGSRLGVEESWSP
jgi:hypothetical protein